MWAAFVDELAGGNANGFGCATPAEAQAHHTVLTAALKSGLEDVVVPVAYDGASA